MTNLTGASAEYADLNKSKFSPWRHFQHTHSPLTVADHTIGMRSLSGEAWRSTSVSGSALLLFLPLFSCLWTVVSTVSTSAFVELCFEQNQGAPLK